MEPPPRSRDPISYREESLNKRPEVERSYSRVPSRDINPPIKNEPPKPHESSAIDTKKAKLEITTEPGRDNLNTKAIGSVTRPSTEPKREDRRVSSYTGYDRPPPPPAPIAPLERYERDPRGYESRSSYSSAERDGRRASGYRADPPYEKRDSRDPYYSNYSEAPPSEYRRRATYPPRDPMEYARGPPPSSYGEKYPPRGPPMEIEPARRREEGYRDLPPRSHEFGTKRKYDESEFRDPYFDDYAVLYFKNRIN